MVITTIKTVFISSGVIAMALFLKASFPLALDFSVSRAPLIWSSLLAWLRPPYLYVVINGIIITIAASSKLHRDGSSNLEEESDQVIFNENPPMKTDPVPELSYEAIKDTPSIVEEEEEKSVVVESSELVEDGADEAALASSAWNPPPRADSLEYLPSVEKPLVSSRFGHRKAVKTSPDGARALRVAKPKRHETLENTWKMITEGKSMPLTRHMKKSDTWENQGRRLNLASDPSHFKKSETFKDRTNYDHLPPAVTATPSPVKLRKEPSLSQEELNRRVEAFIKKFNEEMRLQRLESLKHYTDMIKPGV